MSHFLGKVVRLIKTHKPKDDGERDMLERFETHTTLFVRMETMRVAKPKPAIQLPLFKS